MSEPPPFTRTAHGTTDGTWSARYAITGGTQKRLAIVIEPGTDTDSIMIPLTPEHARELRWLLGAMLIAAGELIPNGVSRRPDPKQRRRRKQRK